MGLLKRPKYVDYNEKGFVSLVYCKICGDVIGDPIANDEYQSVTLEMADGSAHETILCKTCAKGIDERVVDALHNSDMAEMRRESKNAGVWDEGLSHYMSNMSKRQVIRVKEVEGEVKVKKKAA